MMPADAIPPILRLAYLLLTVPLIIVLLLRDAFIRPFRIVLLVMTVLLGFLLVLPLAPLQLQSLLLGHAQGAAVAIITIIAIFSILTFLVGRVFCGYLCPIGALQELAFYVPVKKVQLVHRNLLFTIRLLILILFCGAALLLSFGILHLFGIREVFSLNIGSLLFFVFLTFLFISLFVYRPFCRIFCPLGAIFSIASLRQILKPRSMEGCTACGHCRDICPTGEAAGDYSLGECYLCGRCMERCPEDSMKYTKK